jgi:multisubunit Na+/H+ antiporter MnhB subunit
MIVPTYLIFWPTIAAFIIYLWMYYDRNPERRITDPHMLLAIACFGVLVTQMMVLILNTDRSISSMVLCAAGFGLLILAIRLRIVLTRETRSAQQ